MAAAMAGMHQRMQQVTLAGLAIGMFVPGCRIAVLGNGMQVLPAAAQFVQIASEASTGLASTASNSSASAGRRSSRQRGRRRARNSIRQMLAARDSVRQFHVAPPPRSGTGLALTAPTPSETRHV